MICASPSSNNDSLAGKKLTTEVDGSFFFSTAVEDHRTESAKIPAANQLTAKVLLLYGATGHPTEL